MAPALDKLGEKFVITNQSNTGGRGHWVANFVLTGPGIEPSGLRYSSYETAAREACKRAKGTGASVWFEDKPGNRREVDCTRG